MSRAFKFRHVNEIVGSFVVLAVVLIVVAIFLAGRAQGWFEGTFQLKIAFLTTEGSFGLQEGAEVQIRNTAAGKTGKIVPTPEGHMMTTLKIKERFRPFLTKDSVAKVKKKFGVAGDAFVEVTRGTGLMIEDGDAIACVKDEELMETAQKMLEEVEKVVLPMLEEVKSILVHVKNILASVDEGEGIAGAAISDESMKNDIKGVVSHVERITALVTTTVAEANSLLSNQVPGIVERVDTIAGHADTLLTNEVRRAVGDLAAIQGEAVRTLRETRRLIQGVQRHWLLRKYVPSDSEALAVQQAGPGLARELDLVASLDEKLSAARAAADDAEVTRTAANLAVLAAARGDHAEALALCRESRMAYGPGEPPVAPMLIETMVSLKKGDIDAARGGLLTLATVLDRHLDDAQAAQRDLLVADVRLAGGDADGAARALEDARRSVRKADRPELRAALADTAMRIAGGRGDLDGVTAALEELLAECRAAGMFYTLAEGLESAGHVFARNTREGHGALLLLRAARSFGAQGATLEAGRCVDAAGQIAEATRNDLLMLDIVRLRSELTPGQ